MSKTMAMNRISAAVGEPVVMTSPAALTAAEEDDQLVVTGYPSVLCEYESEGPGMNTRSSSEKIWCRGMKVVQRVWEDAWEPVTNRDQRQRIVHSLKVGVALSISSLLMILDAPDDFLGSNAIWAVMTVVVVFESSVGATISKAINRSVATAVAGFLALGMEMIADEFDGGFKAVAISLSVMVVGIICTSLRFNPLVKAKFDYGLVIFMLTYALILVSGFKISLSEDMRMAWERLFVILMASIICLVICIGIFPAWAGTDLHNLIASTFDDLSLAVEVCANKYTRGSLSKLDHYRNDFVENITKDVIMTKLHAILGLGSSMDNLEKQAFWEPFHEKFRMRNPWEDYVKVGKKLRELTHIVLAMDAYINSTVQIKPRCIPAAMKMEMVYAIAEISKLMKELGASIRRFHKCGEKKVIMKAVEFSVWSFQTSITKHLQSVFTKKHSEQRNLKAHIRSSFSMTYAKPVAGLENRSLRRANSCSSLRRATSLPTIRSPSLRLQPRNSSRPPCKISFICRKSSSNDKVAFLQPSITVQERQTCISLAAFSSLLDDLIRGLHDVVDMVHELGEKATFEANSHNVPFVDIV